MTIFQAVHMSPAWREQSNLLFTAAIEEHGDSPGREQLWGKIISKNTALLCCIPFFLYDLSIGDLCNISDDFKFISVREAGDQDTYRIFFSHQFDKDSDLILEKIKAFDCLFEWYSQRLLAVSVRKSISSILSHELQLFEEEGLLEYETGRL